MAADTLRGRQILLGVLVGVAALVAYQVWSRTSAAPAAPIGSSTVGARGDRATPSPAAAADVHLQALEAERPRPLSLDRNLFRFRPKAPPPPSVIRVPVVQPPVAAEQPPAAPRLPPIPLRFLGIVEAPDRSLTLAVLGDGVHVPTTGRVGDVIEGRYRILRIGPDSIEMAYVDGRGRQTIRLTGS